jgi:F0F1-type ATP synthase assembly protein I
MENPHKLPTPDPKAPTKWAMLNLASELGFIIALPLVAFALGGKWLDHKMHNTTPWFTLLGIVLAITSTTVWITKKLKKYIK